MLGPADAGREIMMGEQDKDARVIVSSSRIIISLDAGGVAGLPVHLVPAPPHPPQPRRPRDPRPRPHPRPPHTHRGGQVRGLMLSGIVHK